MTSPASLTIGRMAPLSGSFYGYGTGAYGEGIYGVGTGSGGLPPTMWGARVWDADGDQVNLAGFLHAPAVGDALALRQQILGYVDNADEPVIPLTWAADSTISGFYRVLKANVAMKGASLAHGLFQWQMQLERVVGYAAPVIESVMIGNWRANAHGLGGAISFHAVPAAVTDYTRSGILDDYVRVGANGDLRINKMSIYNTTLRFSLAPAHYYDGAATFELGSGSLFRTIVGRQCESLPTAWRLSNDLVRVTPSATAGRLDISHYDGAAWVTKTYNFRIQGSHHVNLFTSVAVLRNAPEAVVIRLGCSTEGGLDIGPVTIDLELRRGDRLVRGFIQSDVARAWRFGRNTAEASTLLTGTSHPSGGIRATSNDANGDRFALFTTLDFSADLTNGSIYADAAVTRMDFGIGLEVNGSAAVEPDRVFDLSGNYFSAQAERQMVVRR